MSLADMSVRRHLDLLVAFGLELLALSPLEDLQASGFSWTFQDLVS